MPTLTMPQTQPPPLEEPSLERPQIEQPEGGTDPLTQDLLQEIDTLTHNLGQDMLEKMEKDDLYHHCRQGVSAAGRILVSKKAWIFRVLFLTGMTVFMIYNLIAAISAGDPLIVYAMLMQIHALIILTIGWFIFKNKARGTAPTDLVSVIIPVYNQEKLIGKVINAILDSTYSNIEVVAVNDGSKDNSSKVLDELASRNPRLRVVHKPNGGKRTAVAAGFEAAHGNYIVLIDSDSIVDRYAIGEFMKVFSANPRVGGIVGNGKVLNANKNFLTRCQDVWYDNTFNIHKASESTFGTVLCLSGCLAAYRREAVAAFIPFWVQDKTQYSDDRSLTTYAFATPWAKGELAPLERSLMKSMASYDDAEDRALTSQAIIEWQTVYAPTAVVYTEVPEKWKQYMRQQIRWRKGYLRSTFFASAFFWRKNPIMALLFYLEFMSAFVAPAIAFSIFVYRPVFLNSYWFLVMFVLGQLLIGFAVGIDYKFRDPTAKNWIYKPLMNLISAFVLPWVMVPALLGFRQKGWLTR
jgi:hyaluronan synthase